MRSAWPRSSECGGPCLPQTVGPGVHLRIRICRPRFKWTLSHSALAMRSRASVLSSEIRTPGLAKGQGACEAQRRCEMWVPALQVPNLSLRQTPVGVLLGHLGSPTEEGSDLLRGRA